MKENRSEAGAWNRLSISPDLVLRGTGGSQWADSSRLVDVAEQRWMVGW
jgi:hypothetical protein